MTGLIKLKSGIYAFRNDHGFESGIWAWNIKDDYTSAMVHKWKKLPNEGIVTLFNIDYPPQTVSYIPILD